MVTRLSLLAGGLSLLAASSALADPITHPRLPDSDKLQTQLSATSEAARFPLLPATQPSGILRCSIVNNMLQVDVLNKSAGMFRVATGDSRVVATIRQPTLRNAAEPVIFYLIRDFSPPGARYVFTTVASGAGPTQIVRDFEDGDSVGKTELIQDPPPSPEEAAEASDPIRLTIEQTSEPAAASDFTRKLSARSFVELQRRYPAEVSEYLGPIFRDLGQDSSLAFDPAVAWEVLDGDATPDPAVTALVEQLLPPLGAASFTERRAALRSLHTLGAPAALVLRKMDRAGLNLEQINAIDTFVSSFEPLDAKMAGRLAGDPNYLLNIQYSNDAALRTLAATRLSQLLGRPVAFDPKSSDAIRLPAVEAVCKTLPATSPSTQPAESDR